MSHVQSYCFSNNADLLCRCSVCIEAAVFICHLDHFYIDVELCYPKCFQQCSKPREISNFIQGNDAFHLAACQWCLISRGNIVRQIMAAQKELDTALASSSRHKFTRIFQTCVHIVGPIEHAHQRFPPTECNFHFNPNPLIKHNNSHVPTLLHNMIKPIARPYSSRNVMLCI